MAQTGLVENPEIEALNRRIDALEASNRTLAHAVLVAHLGSHIHSEKHAPLRRAIKYGAKVRIRFRFEEREQSLQLEYEIPGRG